MASEVPLPLSWRVIAGHFEPWTRSARRIVAEVQLALLAIYAVGLPSHEDGVTIIGASRRTLWLCITSAKVALDNPPVVANLARYAETPQAACKVESKLLHSMLAGLP